MLLQAFFTPEYCSAHPEEAKQLAKLKDLIASQVPLLEVGVQLHKLRAPSSLGPFQQRLEQCFREMQVQVEANYGKKVCKMRTSYATYYEMCDMLTCPDPSILSRKDSHTLF